MAASAEEVPPWRDGRMINWWPCKARPPKAARRSDGRSPFSKLWSWAARPRPLIFRRPERQQSPSGLAAAERRGRQSRLALAFSVEKLQEMSRLYHEHPGRVCRAAG